MIQSILEKLGGGDLRSEGQAPVVAEQVRADPTLLDSLVAGLDHGDKLIRGRTCMALEVISRDEPGLLVPVLPCLIELASKDRVAQVRWHIAEVLCNVPVSPTHRDRAIPVLLEFLDDKSKIVRYCAVQALGVLGRESPRLAEIARRIDGVKDDSKGLAKAVHRAHVALGTR